ncbi:MAG: hypothetical protein RJA83_692 [Pseudomonadota bacterium]|jgi:hypothetical protein
MQQTYRLRKIIIEKATREDFPASLIQHIRYIDPVIWPSLLGVYELLQLKDKRPRANDVGVILCGKSYPKEASARVLESLLKNGRVSPLHFTAANAAASISMICATFHFHGPTLNLCMPVQTALPTIEIIIQHWLSQNIKTIFVIKQDHQHYAQIEHIFVDEDRVEDAVSGVSRNRDDECL